MGLRETLMATVNEIYKVCRYEMFKSGPYYLGEGSTIMRDRYLYPQEKGKFVRVISRAN